MPNGATGPAKHLLVKFANPTPARGKRTRRNQFGGSHPVNGGGAGVGGGNPGASTPPASAYQSQWRNVKLDMAALSLSLSLSLNLSLSRTCYADLILKG